MEATDKKINKLISGLAKAISAADPAENKLTDSGSKKRKRPSSPTKKSIQPNTSQELRSLQDLSIEHGLDELQINKLVKIIVALSKNEDQSTSIFLIRALIPRYFVSTDDIVNLMGPFVTYNMELKVAVLTWLLLVVDLIRDRSIFDKLYAVFFLYLKEKRLRPLLCNLLSMITRACHVQPFRARALNKLAANSPNEPELQCLCSVFHQYNKMVTVSPNVSSTFEVFKCPDSEWSNQIAAIQSKYNKKLVISFDTQKIPLENESDSEEQINGSNNNSNDNVSPKKKDKKKVAVVETWNKKAIINNTTAIHNADLFNLTTPVNEHLIHLLSLNYSEESRDELERMFNNVLLSAFNWRNKTGNKLLRRALFDKMLQFASVTKELLPSMYKFLSRYLKTWDFDENIDLVLKLLEFIKPSPYEVLSVELLQFLNTRLFFAQTPEKRAQVFNHLTEMLLNWFKVDWVTIIKRQKADPNFTRVEHFVFNELEPNVDYMKTIAETIKFLDGVGVLALQLDRDHVLMQNAVLNFFEVICRLHSKFKIPFSTPPSSYCVYRMLLSASCMPLSRMCAVLTRYKSEFDNLRLGISNKLVPELSFKQGLDKVAALNGYIWSFCYAIWRDKVFAGQAPAVSESEFSNPLMLPVDVRDKIQFRGIDSALSIAYSYSLGSIGWTCLKELTASSTVEKPGQPATIPVLRTEHFREQNIRFHYLDYLRKKGCKGIFKFLYTFVGQLAKRKQALDEKKSKNQTATNNTPNNTVNNVHAAGTNGVAQTK